MKLILIATCVLKQKLSILMKECENYLRNFPELHKTIRKTNIMLERFSIRYQI